MDEKNYDLLCQLDKLVQLIKNCNKTGNYTKAKKYQDYYDKIREEEDIKKEIKGTIHEIK